MSSWGRDFLSAKGVPRRSTNPANVGNKLPVEVGRDLNVERRRCHFMRNPVALKATDFLYPVLVMGFLMGDYPCTAAGLPLTVLGTSMLAVGFI
jgi:hypothetical protein